MYLLQLMIPFYCPSLPPELVIAVWCLCLMFQAQPTFGKKSLYELMVNSSQERLQTGNKH